MLGMLRPVRTEDAKPPLVQLWEQVHWGARLMVTPNDYRAYHLYRKDRGRRDALRYLSGPRAVPMFTPLNRETDLLIDKLAFENRFSALGLPVPRTLAVTDDTEHVGDRPVLRSAEEISAFLRERLLAGQELVLKMLDAERGIGVRVATGIDGDDLLMSNGERAPLGPTVDDLLASGRVWLIQERIVQHPELAELNPSSLNSLRVVTFRHRNGEVEVPYAVLLAGRASRQIDGYEEGGGLLVKIDPATGRYGEQGAQRPNHSLLPVDRHPDSGIVFAGRTYPFWSEVLELARAFAQHAGANRFIGWDIATTPSGPLMMEGNQDFDVGMVQLHTDGMLTDEFVDLIGQETGVRYEAKQLPPLRPVLAARSLRARLGPDVY
jgi:hypothetical protein